ncbi:hypothetical protein BJV82DRAFT_671532 [Fennellomyces sp. T-0311]|nr:hypothetical protein BJV82DRAFT_671532 [Fennellomyces sp. T-0311]
MSLIIPSSQPASSSNAPPILPPITAFPHLLPKPDHSRQWTKDNSDAILAEKRRRNAGASSRFRERRKQREKELQERVVLLEQRVQQLQTALRQYNPKHPLIEPSSSSSSPQDLGDRVSQLESMMTRFREEKESDTQKLDALEKENSYLKSLLKPSMDKPQ